MSEREPEREGEALPPARLTSAQVDAVLRRAVELQAAEAEGGDALTEEDLLRIGREVGIDPAHLGRALAEVGAVLPEEAGWLRRVMGERAVSAGRSVAMPADRARAELDAYLREEEFMVVHRRLPGRTIYTRASGLAADFGRFTSDVARRHPRINAPELEVLVREAGAEETFVALRLDLAGRRAGLATGGMAAGTGSAGVVAAAFGLALAPPAAVLGLPVLAGSLWGSRRAYRAVREKRQRLLESLLDRLEHGELKPPRRGWRRLLEGG
jgi:hypothetical protein